ncbi:MAG: retropepsin-like domain-containing protein [Candidatus Eisenbacteria bacterium]|nr:retropepsin-like domain-containing protein [Candidatus Eisenbacteria bacterium]
MTMRHGIATACGLLLLMLAPVPARSAVPDTSGVPTLRSGVRVLDVRENGIVRPADWTVDPSIALDEYRTGPVAGPARLTFVSDVDSLTIEVEPGHPREFAVLLGDSVRCMARIVCQAGLTRAPGGTGPVELPLRWSRNRKLTIRARINGSPELNLLFDSGAADLTLYRSGVKKVGGIETDGEVLNHASGGSTVRRVRRSNTLEIGPLRGEGIPVMVVESQPEPVDGIVGFRMFADRTLEFDFEREKIVVHDSLPALPAGFTSLPLLWSGTLHSVNARVQTERGTFDVPFVMDTGLNGTFNLGAATSGRLGLPEGVKALGWSKGKGLGENKLRLQRLRFRALELGGTRLSEIPGFALAASDTGAVMGDLLGMEVLRRFRFFLDYRGNALVLAPNRDLGEHYRRGGRGGSGSNVAITIAILVALGAGEGARRKRRGGQL